VALSNWDTWAMDSDGKSTNGVFADGDVSIIIYKNWLYVEDKSAWEEGKRYVEPVVMEINSGELTYKGIEIRAIRGPKQGIYCLVNNREGFMLGIGCYGYVGEDFIGVTEAEIEHLKRWVLAEDIFYGDLEEKLKGIDFMSGGRFNQGDAYFADKLGEGIPNTAPGNSKEPIVTMMLNGIKEGI